MKKLITMVLLVGALFLSTQNAEAQTQGFELGLRFVNTNSAAVDFAMPLGANRMHAFLNLYNGGIGVAGLYDWQFPFADGFMFYPGIGVALSLVDNPLGGTDMYLAAGGEAGVEYQFDFPLTLGIDYQLRLGIVNFRGYGDGWGVNARWRF